MKGKMWKTIAPLLLVLSILCGMLSFQFAFAKTETVSKELFKYTDLTVNDAVRTDPVNVTGLQFKVGEKDIKVTHLGRFYVTESTNDQIVALYDEATLTKLAEATVNGGQKGQFTYIQLAEPLTLTAGETYILIASNKYKGNVDNYVDCGKTKEVAPDITMVNIGVFSGNLSDDLPETLTWNGNIAEATGYCQEGDIFGNAGLKYEVEVEVEESSSSEEPSTSTSSTEDPSSSTPSTEGPSSSTPSTEDPSTSTSSTVDPSTSTSSTSTPAESNVPMVETPFVTSVSAGTPRQDFTGYVGMAITIGAKPITVTQLGRVFIEGNTQSHIVKIVDAEAKKDVASVTVKGGKPNKITYAKLAAPVVLEAGHKYYVVSQETANGDMWYHGDAALKYAGVATIDGACYGDGTEFATEAPAQGKKDGTYGPVSFMYLTEKKPGDASQNGAPQTGADNMILVTLLGMLLVSSAIAVLAVFKKSSRDRG